MGSYYGDNMLLKELLQLTNIKLALSDGAKEIEIADAFSQNPIVTTADSEVTIICTDEDILRAVNLNFKKNTISEIFSSTLGHGGVVYSNDGLMIKIIN